MSGLKPTLDEQASRTERDWREMLAVMWLAVLQGRAEHDGAYAKEVIKEVCAVELEAALKKAPGEPGAVG